MLLLPTGFPNVNIAGVNPLGTELRDHESISAKIKSIKDAEAARVAAAEAGERAAREKAEAEERASLEAQLAAESAVREAEAEAAALAQQQAAETPDETTEAPAAETPRSGTFLKRLGEKFQEMLG